MSINRISSVWEHSKHKGGDLLLLLALADNASDDGYCWPSIDTLAQKSRSSESTVIRASDRLEKSGELFVNHNRRRGNTYIVLVGISDETIRQVMKNRMHLSDEKISSNMQLIENRRSNCQIDSSEVAPVTDDPSLTIKDSSQAKERPEKAQRKKADPKTPTLFGTIQADLVKLSYGGNAQQYGSAADLAKTLLGVATKTALKGYNLAVPFTPLEWSAFKLWYADQRDRGGNPIAWAANAGSLNRMVYKFRVLGEKPKYMKRAEALDHPVEEKPLDTTMLRALQENMAARGLPYNE